MGKIVQVNPGYSQVTLYDGHYFNAGESATLTDAEYAALNAAQTRAITVTNGSVADPVRAFSAPQTFADAVPVSSRGAANGVATLDSTGKAPLSQIPIVPGQIIASTKYQNASVQTQALTPATFTTMSDLAAAAIAVSWTGATATMFDITFVVPPSGLVDIEIQAPLSAAAAATTVRFSMMNVSNSTTISNSTAAVAAGTGTMRGFYKQQFSLTPGSSNTWRVQWASSSASNAGQLNGGGTAGTIRIVASASL